MWNEAEPRNYVRSIDGVSIIRAMMSAYIMRMSGLREIVERLYIMLGTHNYSSLSHALSRPSTLRLIRSMVEHLESKHKPRYDELVALDSMAVTLPSTQRHRCKKYNKTTVGGGVLWAFMVDAARGSCPVKVISTMAGAWGDTTLMVGVKLVARGPVYLMDRGFWSLELLEQWSAEAVRFIVRARRNTHYHIVHEVSAPRVYGKHGQIEMDAWVVIGYDKSKLHPEARMVRAKIGNEYIILVTEETTWSAERILAAYRKRERIEQFHRLLKDYIGLAHLYNFSHTGMITLLYIALLTALLLFLDDKSEMDEDETIKTMRQAFKELRKRLGFGGIWRRNTNTIKRKATARKYKWQLQQNP